jgi:hypothetical protein
VDFKGTTRWSVNFPRSWSYKRDMWWLFVSITEFIQGVSQFSVKGDKESKLRFAFRIYDMDNDGFISNGELFKVCLRTRLGSYPPFFSLTMFIHI